MAGAAGPKPSLEWYQVYEWTSFVDVSSFSYTLDRSSTAPSFSRILYIMALDDYAVWIEFDDFTSNTANRIGVPLSWTYETNVTNMIVKYSRPGIFPGADNATIYNRITPVTGRINFWPSNYGTTGENDGLYDSDDSGYDSGDGYGSFQFFDVSVSPSQCIYAWNYWGTSADFGLGNKSGGHPDWTFTYNVNSFPYKLGRIYVK